MSGPDPRRHDAQCKHCGHAFEYQRYHAGFSNQGYMYCDQDETLLTWGTYNPHYKQIVNKHPWMLDADERRQVEAMIKPCPYGGRFGFGNEPRCPACNRELPELATSPIYYVVIGRTIDGDESDMWVA